MSFGGDINAVDTNGRTPIFFCKTLEMYNTVKKYDPYLYKKDFDGDNILHYFCRYANNDTDLILAAIKDGVNCMHRNLDNGTCLHSMAKSNICVDRFRQEAIFKILLKYGVKIDVPNIYGKTALYLASTHSNAVLIRALLQAEGTFDVLFQLLHVRRPSKIGIEEIIKFLVFKLNMDEHVNPEIVETVKSLGWSKKMFKEHSKFIKKLINSEIIPNSATYYKLLKSDEEEMLRIVGDPEVEAFFLREIDSIHNDTFNFTREVLEVVKEKFMRREERKGLLFLQKKLEVHMPYACIQKILALLKREDFVKLLDPNDFSKLFEKLLKTFN